MASPNDPQYDGTFGASDPSIPAVDGQHTAPYGHPAQAVPYGQPVQPPPGAYAQPYGQPYGYGHPYVPPQRTNGMAIASMVLGILWLYWIGSILALVFGYIAKNQIRERGEAGGGMATAGIVLGWIGVGFIGVAIVAGIAASV